MRLTDWPLFVPGRLSSVYSSCLSEGQGLSPLFLVPRPQWEELRPLSLVPPRHGSTYLDVSTSRKGVVALQMRFQCRTMICQDPWVIFMIVFKIIEVMNEVDQYCYRILLGMLITSWMTMSCWTLCFPEALHFVNRSKEVCNLFVRLKGEVKLRKKAKVTWIPLGDIHWENHCFSGQTSTTTTHYIYCMYISIYTYI